MIQLQWQREAVVSSSYDLSKHGLYFAERMGSTSTNPNMARLQNYRNADAVDYEGGSAGRTLNATGGDFTWLFAGRGLELMPLVQQMLIHLLLKLMVQVCIESLEE